MFEIIYADGSLHAGTAEELSRIKNKKVWIDCTNLARQEAEILREKFDLHPLTIEDLITSKVRIKIEHFPYYILCVFYAIQRRNTITPVEIDFVLSDKFLITNHLVELPAFTAVKQNKEKIAHLFNRGIDFVFHSLLDVEIDNYYPILDHIADRINSTEEKITANPSTDVLKEILHLRRILNLMRKIVIPQREKLRELTKGDNPFISEKVIPYFRDIYDHSILVMDSIESNREDVIAAFEMHASTLSNRMTEVMKFLSAIATIALPLTVISGIYGTNFSHLPGSDSIYGFYVMMLIMAVFSGMMLHLFRKRGWI